MSWSDDYHKLVEEDRKKKKKQDTPETFETSPYSAMGRLAANASPEVYKQTVQAVKEEQRTSKKQDEEEEERKWFQKGAFEDGYQFGDVLRTVEGTLKDIRENAITGVLGIGEAAVDAGAYIVGGVGKLFGADDFADKTKAFISDDLIDEEKIAKVIVNVTTPGISTIAREDTDDVSLLGEKTDSLVQSGGQLLGTAGLQALGVPWFVTSGVTSFGSEAENAFKQGASYGEAGLSATISAGAEILTEKLFGGSGLGEKGLINLDGLTKGISNKLVKALADYGLDIAGEGFEEVFSQVASNLGSALYREENLGEILLSEEALDGYLESFIGGAALGGVANVGKAANSIQTGRDYRTGMTANEQKVFDKVYADEMAEAEKNKGKKLTSKEKAEIYDRVAEDLAKGYISTDTIEEVLGGDTYQSYRDTVDNEDALVKEYDTLGDLKESELTVKQRKRLNELEAQISEFQKTDKRNQLKTKLGEEVFSLVKNDRLSESYAEKSRRGQAFAADLSKYDAKQRQTIQKAIDSGILNDTNRTHEFVDFVAKLSADKGVPFDFTNNAKLKETGFALEGVTVNGFVNESGVTMNVNSAKALNAVVGHEITHVLEGTELYDSLKTAITEYAKSKGDYDSRLAQLTKLYEGRNANIEQEVVADLVGDYLFTNKDFVKRLCTEHRNVFQKIYDEIKYLCKVVTAGSKEARQLERVKKAFEEAYRQDAKKPTRDGGVRYSLSSIVGASGKNYGVGVYLDSTLLSNLTEDERIDMVKEYIKELGGSVFTAYDNNGNAVDIHIVESSKKFKNKSGKRVSVNKDLMYRLKNEVKQEAIALVDELVQASTYHGKEPATHPHDWVDDNGANDWDLWKTYIQDKQNTIWEASLRIANSANGDKILYDIFPIKMVEGAGTAATTTTNNNIAQTPPTVNTPNSLSEQGADDIAPMPWQIKGKDVALEDIAPAKETLTAETAGQTKSPVSQAEDAVATPREFISLEDYANNESPVWRNVGYADEETKAAITQETHDRMVSSGAVVTVAGDVMDKVEKSFPDLRGMKKTERTPILKEAINKLKSNIRQFLTGLSNQNFEFEVNGKVLEAKLYSTGINEVLEKVTKDKANMLYSTEGIFQNAQYLYSTPDYDGDPNVYRWNYFYTPVRIGEDVVGVRIAVRDMVRGTDGATPESQIYNWGIKKNASLDGGSHGPRVASSGVSSDALNNNIPQNPPNVNPDDSTGAAPAGETATVNQAKSEAKTAADRINDRLKKQKAELVEEFMKQKAEMKDKTAWISKKAAELYDEIRNIKKGVKASEMLGELLDSGNDWSSIRSALVNIKHSPDNRVNIHSSAENLAREMLNEEYENRLYNLEDDYRAKVKQATEEAKKAIAEAEKAERAVKRSDLHRGIVDGIKARFSEKGLDFDKVLRSAKNLSTFATVDNTPQRVMEKTLGYKEGQILSDITVNQVAQNETAGIKWLNEQVATIKAISKQYGIKPGSKESAAAQMYAEGFYVDDKNNIVQYGNTELAKDFPDANVQRNIKKLASDPRIRKIYDDTLGMINESRARNAYPEIQKLDNYFLHFRAMSDTFSKLGLPFNPNDIRAKDLPTDLNGVTADLKPGQPYFASAMHRKGKRTSFDLLGGLEQYLSAAKNQIYHIDDIQTLRAMRNYIADTYGQANGLEGLDALSEEEAQERIEKVYNSHLSTFAKFLNEEANILAGKTALIDRGLEGIIGRRGITFLDTVNKQVGSNMVGWNISSSLTNFLPVAQTFAKTNKADFVKAFGQTVANKVGSIFGRTDGFTDNSPVVIRRKGADRFHRTPFQKVGDAGYAFMSAVDDISTELIARTKYNELTRKGMDSQQAHIETDKWVSRLMGDRSLGQQPQLYNSKMLGIITKFQLEVRNQLDSQFYDTIQEAKASNEDIENGLLRNAKTAAKVTSTFVQLAVAQHLFGKAFESVAGYNPAFDIIGVLMTALGFDDEEESEDTALDNIEQAFLELLEDLPYTSTFTGGRIPISSALPIKELVTGKDEWGNEKSRWETLGEAAPYYVLPGGYGQIKKTMQGLGMFSEDHPIAGSYTDKGDLRFPVDDTLLNRVQAGIFGQYASANARDYFDNGRSPLNEKQLLEFMDVDMTIQEYWDYREGMKGKDTLGEKVAYIYSLDLPMRTKNILVNNLTDRDEPIDLTDFGEYDDWGEFEYAHKYPEKYDFLEANNISAEQYESFDEDTKAAWNWAYQNQEKFTVSRAISDDFMTYYQYKRDLVDLKADKDANGESIPGSKKEKVIDYINSLDIDYGQKIILFRSMYDSKEDRANYNADILDYLNGREDLTYEDIETILKELGFNVDSEGNVTWN